MIDAKPASDAVAEALRVADQTLDPAEQRLAPELLSPPAAGKPVAPGDLASSAEGHAYCGGFSRTTVTAPPNLEARAT